MRTFDVKLLVSVFSLGLVVACADATSVEPRVGDRRPDATGSAAVDASHPCHPRNAKVVQVRGGVLNGVTGKADGASAAMQFEAALAVPGRDDRIVVELQGAVARTPITATQQISFASQGDRGDAVARLSLGRVELRATSGQLAFASYDPALRAIDANLLTVQFQEVDTAGQVVAGGCTLALTGPARLAFAVTGGPVAPTPDPGAVEDPNAAVGFDIIEWAGPTYGPIIAGASAVMWERLSGWAEALGVDLGTMLLMAGPNLASLVMNGIITIIPTWLFPAS